MYLKPELPNTLEKHLHDRQTLNSWNRRTTEHDDSAASEMAQPNRTRTEFALLEARLGSIADGIITLERYLKGEVSDREKNAVKQLVEGSDIIASPSRLKEFVAGLITRFNNDPQAIKAEMLFDGKDEDASGSGTHNHGDSEIQMPRAPRRAHLPTQLSGQHFPRNTPLTQPNRPLNHHTGSQTLKSPESAQLPTRNNAGFSLNPPTAPPRLPAPAHLTVELQLLETHIQAVIAPIEALADFIVHYDTNTQLTFRTWEQLNAA
jgi:hypothetical protein